MSVTLLPGVRATVQVRDIRSQVLYEANFTSKNEAKEFIVRHEETRNGYSLFQGVVFPLRTGDLKDFAEDLFLPTFIHFASKVENIALRFFASILAIALDFLTLPVRLVTASCNHNNPERKHAILGLIENHPLAQKAIEDNRVNLCYEVEDVQISDPTYENGDAFQHATKSSVKGTIQVALRTLPGGAEMRSSEGRETASYLGRNGEWTHTGSGHSSSSHSVLAF